MITDSIKRKITKLHTLSTQGENNERQTAEQLLTQLLNKYEVSLEYILNSEEVYKEWYKYRSVQEREILEHLFAKTASRGGKYTYYTRKGERALGFECTKFQHIQIAEEYAIYRKAWKEEQSRLLRAFIHANEIFPESNGEGSPKERTPEELEEIRAMLRMAESIDKTPIHKAIA